MNFLSVLMAVATLYDELAKGGAKAKADEILAAIVPVVQAAPALTALTGGAHSGSTDSPSPAAPTV